MKRQKLRSPSGARLGALGLVMVTGSACGSAISPWHPTPLAHAVVAQAQTAVGTARDQLRRRANADERTPARADYTAPGLDASLRPEIATTPLRDADARLTLDQVRSLPRWREMDPAAPDEPKPGAAAKPAERQAALKGYLSARLKLLGSEPEMAAADLRRAAARDAGSPELQRLLGEALMGIGDAAGAEHAFARAVALGDADPRLMAAVARGMAEAGDHERALASFFGVLDRVQADAEFDPGYDATLFMALVPSLDRLGYRGAARDALDRVCAIMEGLAGRESSELAPEGASLRRALPAVRIELGDRWLRSREPEAADRAYMLYQQGLAGLRSPGPAETLRLVTSAVRSGRWFAAAEALVTSIERTPGPVRSWQIEVAQSLVGVEGGAASILAESLRALASATEPASVARSQSFLATACEAERDGIGASERADAWLSHLERFTDDRRAAKEWRSVAGDVFNGRRIAERVERSPALVAPLAWAMVSGDGASLLEWRGRLEVVPHPAGNWLRAEAKRVSGDVRGALESIDGDLSVQADVIRALAAAEAGDDATLREAVDRLERVGTPEARLAIAEAWILAGNAGAALEAIDAPGDGAPIAAAQAKALGAIRARALMDDGEFATASAIIEASLRDDPTDDDMLALRAWMHETGGPKPDGEAWGQAMQSLRDLDSGGAKFALLRAKPLLDQRRWEQAWAALSIALAHDPFDDDALAMLARLTDATSLGGTEIPRDKPAPWRMWIDRRISESAGIVPPRWACLAALAQTSDPLRGLQVVTRQEGERATVERSVIEADDAWLELRASGVRWPALAHLRRLTVLAVASELFDRAETWEARLHQAAEDAAAQPRHEIEALVLGASGEAFEQGRTRAGLALMVEWVALDRPMGAGLDRVRAMLPLFVEVGTASQLRRYLVAMDRRGEADRIIEGGAGGVPADAIMPARGPNAKAEIAYNVGAIAWNRGRGEEALRMLELALEFQPGHVWASNDLGYFLAESGQDLERAERHLVTAFAGAPHDGSVLDSLAWVRYKLGRIHDGVDERGQVIDGALSLLRRAVATPKGVDNPTILDHYGDALWRAGLKAEAERAWADAQRAGLQDEAGKRAGGVPPGDTSMRELTKRLRSLEAKLTAARQGQDPPIAPQGAHGIENEKPRP